MFPSTWVKSVMWVYCTREAQMSNPSFKKIQKRIVSFFQITGLSNSSFAQITWQFWLFSWLLFLCCVSSVLSHCLRSTRSHLWRRGGEEEKREPDRQKLWHLSLTAEWWRKKMGDRSAWKENLFFIFTFQLPISRQREANEGAEW